MSQWTTKASLQNAFNTKHASKHIEKHVEKTVVVYKIIKFISSLE